MTARVVADAVLMCATLVGLVALAVWIAPWFLLNVVARWWEGHRG